jgi:asparagine synthase (glutamine-hydrolysing)
MCGICGIIDFAGATVHRETIKVMADSLWHRGSDDAGYHFEPGVGLGHRRLSIIDLNIGRQPISNEDGTIWVAHRGMVSRRIAGVGGRIDVYIRRTAQYSVSAPSLGSSQE